MRIVFWLMLVIVAVSCIEPIASEDLAFEDLLIVEGLLTDQFRNQVVRLSRTLPLTSSADTIRPATGATVWVEDVAGTQYAFRESAPGIYLSNSPFAGVVNQQYRLLIESSEKRYQSDFVTLLATPEIDSVYGEFAIAPTSNNSNDGDFSFYVDAKQNDKLHRYFRWTWNSTFELTMANPSRWLWTGGNTFVNRDLGNDNRLQVERCWRTETSSRVIIDELLVPESGIDHFLITQFNSDERKMLLGYSLEVKQYAIAESAFQYWSEVAQSTQEQGSLSDIQVGTIQGNVRSISNPGEVVLGIFEAAQEVAVRRQFEAFDFVDEGYRRRTTYFVDCNDIIPMTSHPDEIGVVMDEFGDSFSIAYFITSPPTVVYYPKRCSECTLFGDNQRPDFWLP